MASSTRYGLRVTDLQGLLRATLPLGLRPGWCPQSYDAVASTYARLFHDSLRDRLAALLRDHGLAEAARTVIEPKPTDQRQFQEVQLLACKT